MGKRVIREVWAGDHFRMRDATSSGSDLVSIVESTSRWNFIIYSTFFTHLLKSVAVVCILVILLTLICETLTDILWQLLER